MIALGNRQPLVNRPLAANRLWLALLIVCYVLAGANRLWAQPEEIVLNDADQFSPGQRPPVVFPHELHMEELDCLRCHHRMEAGRNVLDEDELVEGNEGIRCASCHNDKSDIGLMDAFHRQCIQCHGRRQQDGEPSGPRLCGECHRKTAAGKTASDSKE